MYTHNIDTVLLSNGPLEIRYYGLVYVLGFIIALFVLDYYRKKGELKMTKNQVWDLVFWMIIGVIAGARLFEVFVWNPVYYFNHPLDIFAVWKGGMSLHGGIVGILLVGYFYCKKNKLNLAQLADILVIPAALILGLGRIANFINGELWGTVTNVPWCVMFKGADGCRHPVQLYGAIGRIGLFALLMFMMPLKQSKKWKDGILFWSFVLLMGIGRFAVDFFREDQRYFYLSTGQYLSLIMAIVALFILLKYYKK
ncbi:prolipoprotein diacylglyceryl transferase [Candidatus Woesearchaeota archaeon]|nr:prolipoprotein diacylglyceryl transferase [Candidatus Woesearchaeota archaeon]